MRWLAMSLFVLSMVFFGALAAFAQTYQQKKSELSQRVILSLPYGASELDVAGAVHRIYDLVFLRGVDSYFGSPPCHQDSLFLSEILGPFQDQRGWQL